MLLVTAATAFLFSQLVFSQFPPKPENVTVLNSKFGDGVYISYKEVSEFGSPATFCLALTVVRSLASVRQHQVSNRIQDMSICQPAPWVT